MNLSLSEDDFEQMLFINNRNKKLSIYCMVGLQMQFIFDSKNVKGQGLQNVDCLIGCKSAPVSNMYLQLASSSAQYLTSN